jgi:asparagine synthase (glutamine-hydrolysing)
VCAIVGIVSPGEVASREAAAAAAGVLRARGPDDAGTWSEGDVALAHRRLSIIDLSHAGHQPMESRDGRYCVVFNGEIYNFREIRRDLDAGPGGWASDSDTEVVLAAYARWGVSCLQRFHGMFAFAIWDRQERVLFAARDRMGVKPFYYHFESGTFAFSSRPRALFTLIPELSQELDQQALRYYLECGYVPAPWSIYRAVRKLQPAHYLLLKGGELTIESYWRFYEIESESAWRGRSENDLLDELDEIVTRSVGLRMVSDVPVGAFLSGGIDSSLVVAMMMKNGAARVKTFTMGFSDKAHDESGHARAVAEHLGTEHYSEELDSEDLLELMPLFQTEYDEPFFDHAAFPTLALSRLARRHVSVSLSGDGGDELFGGYHYYEIAQRLSRAFSLPAAARRGAAALVGCVPSHSAKLLAGFLRQNAPAAAFAFARSVSKDFGAVFTPRLLEDTDGVCELFTRAAARFPPGLTAFEQASRLDTLYTLPDDYLQKVDVASMAFSLESREPLLDQTIVEWAMRLPLEWKRRGGVGKYLLRKLAYRYVPREILDRPKQGFRVPVSAWLKGPLKAWAEVRLNDRSLFRSLPLDQKRVTELFSQHVSGVRNAEPMLWAILILLENAGRRPA